MKKICIVTGTRAEYGLLRPVIDRVYRDEELELCLLVTGMHLSEEFGLTYREIEKDGYPIEEKLEMLLSSDTSSAITKSMGVELIGLGDFFARTSPDMVVVLGDRYEILMVAAAAMMFCIPIAHIHGGELTEGACDDAIRHSLTKMSYLHFPATESYRKRIIQLGEQPERVFNVGALGVENIKQVPLMEKEELEKELKFTFSDKTILVTFHPVTLEQATSGEQFKNLLQVLESQEDLHVIFTKANSDKDGRIINRMIDDFVAEHKDRCVAFASLGQRRYLSVLRYVKAVLGNSSSGLLEVPSFKIPSVNVGDRQKGRLCAESVIHCGNETEEIKTALEQAFSEEFQKQIQNVKNPYEGENPSMQIVNIIKEELKKGIPSKKTFFDL